MHRCRTKHAPLPNHGFSLITNPRAEQSCSVGDVTSTWKTVDDGNIPSATHLQTLHQAVCSIGHRSFKPGTPALLIHANAVPAP